MTKQELLKSLSDETGLSQTQVDGVINALITLIKDEIKAGNDLQIAGLGKFCTSQRAARTGRNPQTGEALNIPAKRVPTFSFAKQMKDAVAQ